MIKNPNSGIIFPENIDENFVLNLSEKYLGIVHSAPVTDQDIIGNNFNV